MVKRIKRAAVVGLCGTFYDSRRQLVEVENQVLAHYGKPPITEDRYMQVFSMASPQALRAFYASIGVLEEKFGEAEGLFREFWNALPPPPLIVSLPKKPRNISDRAVPVFLSLPLVPCQTIEGAFEIGAMSFPILFKAIPRQTKPGGAF